MALTLYEQGELTAADRMLCQVINDPESSLEEKQQARKLRIQIAITQDNFGLALMRAVQALAENPEDPELIRWSASLALVAGDVEDKKDQCRKIERLSETRVEAQDSYLLPRARLLWALGDPKAEEIARLTLGEAEAKGDSFLLAQALQGMVLIAVEHENWPAALEYQERRVSLLGNGVASHDYALLGSLRLLGNFDLVKAEESWSKLPRLWRHRLRRAFGLQDANND
jgi:hypothetical protein